MALISCPECQERVSNKAISCIHCGYPLKELSNRDPEMERIDRELQNATIKPRRAKRSSSSSTSKSSPIMNTLDAVDTASSVGCFGTVFLGLISIVSITVMSIKVF